METITGNTAQENATATTEEGRKYQENMRKFCLVRQVADRLMKNGVLSASEHRDFLAKQAVKLSLDPSVLAR